MLKNKIYLFTQDSKRIKKDVMNYIENGTMLEHTSIYQLVDNIEFLTTLEKKKLYNDILWVVPTDIIGESSIKMGEWVNFFFHPLAPKNNNCYDHIKKRANEFLPLLLDTSVHPMNNV